MIVYYTTLILLTLVTLAARLVDRYVPGDYPALVAWVSRYAYWIVAVLGVLALLPVAWEIAAALSALMGAGEATRRAKGGGTSNLPERPDVEEPEPSTEVSEQVGGASEAVEGDGLESSLADEVKEQAEKLEEAR